MIRGPSGRVISVLLPACVLVVGCSFVPQKPASLPYQPAVLPSVLCSPADAAHMQVIQEGEIVTLMLSSDALFEPNSAHFAPGYRKQLKRVVCALEKSSEHGVVKVAAFTDDWGSSHRNRLLSGQQASAIVAYLTKKAVDTRFLYAVGYGQHWSIAKNTTEQGRRNNRHIEISFRHAQS